MYDYVRRTVLIFSMTDGTSSGMQLSLLTYHYHCSIAYTVQNIAFFQFLKNKDFFLSFIAFPLDDVTFCVNTNKKK